MRVDRNQAEATALNQDDVERLDSPPHLDPSFIVDVNVGKLAKWLRILGYDAKFVNPIEDGLLVEIARQEGRIVLTRDTHIAERRVVTGGQVRVILVEGDRVLEQLRFLAGVLGMRGPFRTFSRCIECNVPLEPIGRCQVKDKVPPYVYRTQERYMTCPRCEKIYWAGTHWERMQETAKQVVGTRHQ